MGKPPETKKALREPETKPLRRARCSETGEFVTAGYAKAHPETTTTETVVPMSVGDSCQFGTPTVSNAGGSSDGC